MAGAGEAHTPAYANPPPSALVFSVCSWRNVGRIIREGGDPGVGRKVSCGAAFPACRDAGDRLRRCPRTLSYRQRSGNRDRPRRTRRGTTGCPSRSDWGQRRGHCRGRRWSFGGRPGLCGSVRSPWSSDPARVPAAAARDPKMRRTAHHRWLTFQGALAWRLPPYPVRGARHSIASNLALLQGYIRAGRLHVRPVITDVIPPWACRGSIAGCLEEKERHPPIIVESRSGEAWKEA
jgi:hypothetical protein